MFGVCFRYLQHIRDQRSRAAMPSLSQRVHTPLRLNGPVRESAPVPDNGSKKKHGVEEDLPQYLYSLAYHVLTFWFMALRMEDRPKQIPWITKNLLVVDSAGRYTMEEQGQVTVDIMNMVAYTDRDHTVRQDNFSKPGDGEIWKKTWVVGNALLTIETAARTGVSQITSRRPCGTPCGAPGARPARAPRSSRARRAGSGRTSAGRRRRRRMGQTRAAHTRRRRRSARHQYTWVSARFPGPGRAHGRGSAAGRRRARRGTA